VHLCIHELVYVCVCVCVCLSICPPVQGFLSHGGTIVPRNKFNDRELYIEDLKSLDIFDQKVHGWLELDYNF
jgi:hypothetical protein